MTVKNEANRRRKWAPKARTGCRTCKTRHVKCDEEKPVCRRCVLSGFRCDGYLAQSNQPEDIDSESTATNNDGTDSTQFELGSSASVSPSKIDSSSSSSSSSSCSSSEEEGSPPRTALIVTTPSQPYVDETSHSLDFFINVTSAMVARSRAAPQFWQVLVPQAAYQYPSVRHAMLAAAVASESLIKREGTLGKSSRSELQVLTHASNAVRSLLTEKVPLDVVLLTSATLGILDLFQGQWDTACTHVTSGAKLAEHARADTKNDRYIAFYCEAFASALPGVLNPNNKPTDVGAPEETPVVRLKEAVESLQLAMESFEQAMPRVLGYKGAGQDRILQVLRNAQTETGWLLTRWRRLLKESEISAPDVKAEVNMLRIESPWSKIMSTLEDHLDHDGPFEVAMFEVAMERTLPFYLLAKAGPNVQMREDATLLMFMGSRMRGRFSGIRMQRAGANVGDSRMLEGS